MPVSSSSVAVGTAATEVASAEQPKKYVYLQDGDFDGDSIVYVGGDNVTTSSGVKLSKTNTTVFELYEFDTLYCIASAGTGSVRVVEVD